MSGKVVVITGASSGLGREAAVQFAAKGWRTVLAARRGDSLEETAQMCREAGGDALAVVTDVSVEQDVQRLAQAALDRFGSIDVWVNNAGVTHFAALDEGPFDEHRRVIEINLFGAIYGVRAVLPVFRRQRRGVLINVGSILSLIGQPAVPSYVISKFALRGLSEALRPTVADEPDIHICTLLPYAIDTPHFQSGANKVGAQAHAMPPVQAPEDVAAALVDLAERPRRERLVPEIANFGLALHWLLPETTEQLILHAIRRWHFSEQPEHDAHGNLYEPSAEHGSVRGTRPPQISTLGFAAWAAGEMVKIQAGAALERVRSLVGMPKNGRS
ncbi:MAG TPA: SDR family NAD(P)-dependent oxidoreductase [Candidatus Limnocylindrales bacterium]|nr:SDR family NAD(P)-dependent oxidoreductase [Candidatus Limnocylindrales bacterium]